LEAFVFFCYLGSVVDSGLSGYADPRLFSPS
jgi:hypothetical protein